MGREEDGAEFIIYAEALRNAVYKKSTVGRKMHVSQTTNTRSIRSLALAKIFFPGANPPH